MPFLTTPDGVRLAYDVAGEGPALVLHLGAGCDSGLWSAAGYLEPLSRSFLCVLFDHRGHGRSDRPRGAAANGIDRYAADVVALLDHLAIDTAAFWGYSAGIGVGVKLADGHPQRIWALVGSGVVSPASAEQRASFAARLIPEMQEHGWERMLERFDTGESDPIPEWMTESIRSTDVQQVTDRLEAALTQEWDEAGAFSRITTPALFIAGDLEDPDDRTAATVAAMRDATRVRLPGLGHINAFLSHDLVLAHVREFLAHHSPEARARPAS